MPRYKQLYEEAEKKANKYIKKYKKFIAICSYVSIEPYELRRLRGVGAFQRKVWRARSDMLKRMIDNHPSNRLIKKALLEYHNIVEPIPSYYHKYTKYCTYYRPSSRGRRSWWGKTPWWVEAKTDFVYSETRYSYRTRHIGIITRCGSPQTTPHEFYNHYDHEHYYGHRYIPSLQTDKHHCKKCKHSMCSQHYNLHKGFCCSCYKFLLLCKIKKPTKFMLGKYASIIQKAYRRRYVKKSNIVENIFKSKYSDKKYKLIEELVKSYL